MRTQLKRGAYVTIFEDPITQTKPEGEARLVRQIGYDPAVERWEVIFLGEDQKVVRVIVPTAARGEA